jgi:hypothetical protein
MVESRCRPCGAGRGLIFKIDLTKILIFVNHQKVTILANTLAVSSSYMCQSESNDLIASAISSTRVECKIDD